MEPVRFDFEAIGTTWQIDCYDLLPPERHSVIKKVILDRVEAFDKSYSRFLKDSLVTRMSQKAGMYPLPPDARVLLDLYARLNATTDGLFTPLIGSVLDSLGYDAAYSLKVKDKPIQILPLDEVYVYSDTSINMKRPMILDFGAAGKGYLIDLIGELLEHNEIFSYCIDASGDILYRNSSEKKLSVGLEHPLQTDQVIGVIELKNGSICGSAGNRRAWGMYHHIINPITLQSPEHVLAVWVTHEDALTADALATALFLAEPKKLATDFTFEYAILYEDLTLHRSEGFEGTFYTKEAI